MARVIERRLLARIMARAAFLWLVLRLIVLSAASAATATGDPGPLPPRLALLSTTIILAAVVVIARADTRALREHTFLANLGVGMGAITGITLATATLLEVAWAMLA